MPGRRPPQTGFYHKDLVGLVRTVGISFEGQPQDIVNHSDRSVQLVAIKLVNPSADIELCLRHLLKPSLGCVLLHDLKNGTQTLPKRLCSVLGGVIRGRAPENPESVPCALPER